MMNRSIFVRSKSVVHCCSKTWGAQPESIQYSACRPAQGLCKRVRLTLGLGTSATNLAMKSKDSKITWLVPTRSVS